MGSQPACPPPQQLHALAHGTLPPADVPTVSRHLAECDACLAQFRRAVAVGRPTDFIESAGTQAVTAPTRSDAGANQTPTTPYALSPTSPGSASSSAGAGYPFLRAAESPDELGRLGTYRVLRLLGRGGMALVFLAEDVTLRRPVALKVMKPELGDDLDPWHRFLREARAMAAIKHEHLVTVYQASHEGEVVYLAMELLQGETLEDRIGRPPQLDVANILRVGREIAVGLSVVHRHGLIHRDLKPGNIWLESPGGKVKILDFGLARAANDDSQITQLGMIVGTPAYMSPEQARSEPLDVRSDLFSFGGVLYSLCTQSRPFRGNNTLAELTSLAVDDPTPVDVVNPAIPRALSDLIMQLLAKDRNLRPASADEVVERLRRLEGTPANTGYPAASTALPVATVVADPDPSAPRKAPATAWPRWALPVSFGFVGLLTVAGLLTLLFGGFSPSPGFDSRSANREATPAVEERVYLDQLTPLRSKHWPFERPNKEPKDLPEKEPPPPPPRDAPQPYDALTLNGKTLKHSFGMHPYPEEPVYVSYRLGKQYDYFFAKVAMNDSSPRSPRPIVYAVRGDNGALLHEFDPVVTREDTQEKLIPVKGVDVLTLEAAPGRGDLRRAHGIWVDPYLIRRR